ncbi:MAG: rhomboid family protein [Chryseobacterium sp.]|nr:rhomboid family protein [Chryseobacterium sp.]
MNTVFIILAVLVIFAYFFRKEIKEKIAPDAERNYTIDDKFNAEKVSRQKEIDQLLSKMGENGIDDLSEKDRKRLDELSRK